MHARQHKIQGSNDDRERKKIHQRWIEYVGELFHYEREQPIIYIITDEPDILKTEAEPSLATLCRKKATRLIVDLNLG